MLGFIDVIKVFEKKEGFTIITKLCDCSFLIDLFVAGSVQPLS
jgi:hypothetical protein